VILLPRAVKVYFATEPANLRRSFDGLSNEVRQVLRHDPLSGHVFVFVNRRRNHAKLLTWTRGGFMIIQKLLERGTFAFARSLTSEAKCIPIDVHELGMLLEGIDFARGRLSRRWEPRAHVHSAAPSS
jgi:transposase